MKGHKKVCKGLLTSKDPNGTVSFIEGLFSIRGKPQETQTPLLDDGGGCLSVKTC